MVKEVAIPKNAPILSVVPTDPWAALIIVAGRSSDYTDANAFSKAVLSAELRVEHRDWQSRPVEFTWRGKHHAFFPNVVEQNYRLPEIDGEPVENAPPAAYRGPHLNAALGSDVVRASYKDYALEYDFTSDTIDRVTMR